MTSRSDIIVSVISLKRGKNMIIDSIENAKKYYSVHPEFKAVFEALAAFDAATPSGRTEIDGDRAFINLSSYVNKPEKDCKFESHAKYADIQFVVCGSEKIDLCDVSAAPVTEDRLENDDIAFYGNPDSFDTAFLTPGRFVVIFPGEAHRPCVAPDGKGVEVKKAVAKILM